MSTSYRHAYEDATHRLRPAFPFPAEHGKELTNPMADILFADDDPAMREMISATLRTAHYHVRLARNGEEALHEIRRAPPDLILLDYRMGRLTGLDVCREVKSDTRLAHLPVLILTGQAQVDDRLRGFDAGADDYLAKPVDPRELLARVSALLRLASLGLDRNPTSRLPGGDAIAREYERRRRQPEPFAMCYLDLDHFKAFNDRFGFAVADRVIRDVGEVLTEVTDGVDAFAGHVGGDDFLLLCRPSEARALTERAQMGLDERVRRYVPVEIARSGHYQSTDREGRVLSFRLTRIAGAIIHIPSGCSLSLSEVGERVTGVKQAAKRQGVGGIAEAELAC